LGRRRLTDAVLDTHVLAWAISDSGRIPKRARDLIATANRLWVSAISFYEIGQKVRLGKWPQMAGHVQALRGRLEDQGAHLKAIDDAVALRAASLDWPHRDPFDRLIAATAMELDVFLVSADAQFDSLHQVYNWRGRIW
jgi:PIN domain nuclease of toxin-antitoxin system